jgi:hypothetical protein
MKPRGSADQHQSSKSFRIFEGVTLRQQAAIGIPEHDPGLEMQGLAELIKVLYRLVYCVAFAGFVI